ncbi:hypothetical protein D3C78_1929890 [compost metagenome]
MIQVAQLVEQVRAETRALDGLEELLGDDEVRVDVFAIERSHQAFVSGKCLHDVGTRG